MDKKESAKILKEHNEWRTWKGDLSKSPSMTDVVKLRNAIDFAVKFMEEN